MPTGLEEQVCRGDEGAGKRDFLAIDKTLQMIECRN